ncbi:MAG: hypothetical protein GC193_14880 [Cryomorphaceae bacterium]|nr:hypothetical protein [Cryomorphaceae bacterium]
MQKSHLSSKSRFILIALCLIAFSGLLVEVTLTKFVAYKVYHHFVYAIVGTVILALGFSGAVVYMMPGKFGKDTRECWSNAAFAAFLSALTLPLSVLLFVWVPVDPYMPGLAPMARLMLFPIYFLNFGLPFFFSGICISHILSASDIPVRRIFFWDLLAAGLGGALCPFILEAIGGYGTICLAAVLSFIAFLLFERIAKRRSPLALGAMSFLMIVAVAGTLYYPGWAISQYGFDVRTHKDSDLRRFVLKDFKRIEKSFWNAIARIDITAEGESNEQWFTYTIAQRLRDRKYQGREVLIDGSAPTRQFKLQGEVKDNHFIGTSLWASPYVVKPDANPSLVIAGGGGIDILIAKYYGIKNVDVVEINPSTYKHILTGGSPSEIESYQRYLRSDNVSRVSVYNKEGRHYASTVGDEHYDVIQASAADTCTAVTSGALSLVENHLYTVDAVHDFMRILKPDGVLSLTHWRIEPPSTGIRQFNTFLKYLDSQNVSEPGRQVLVLADGEWCDCLIKKIPFTEDEMIRVRRWAKETDKSILFDPLNPAGFSGHQSEQIFERLGRADRENRDSVANAYTQEITPVTDDRPYFYGGRNWTRANIQERPLYLFAFAVLAALLLMALPLTRRGALKMSGSLWIPSFYFALCGSAFLLYELTLMQMLTIFVGGPMYSMCVVLVSVLIGYGVGSYFAEGLPLNRRTFLLFSLVVPLVLVVLFFAIPPLVKSCMALPMIYRVAISVCVTLGSAVVVGASVPTAMAMVREKHQEAVAWMWGVNSAFNGIGAMSFALITEKTGISFVLLLVALAYLFANLVFAMGAVAREDSSESC